MKRLLIVVCLGLALVGCRKEAKYQGKTESEWIEALQDKDVATRRSASLALAEMGNDASKAQRALQAVLANGSEDRIVRANAAYGLLDANDRAKVPLAQIAVHPNGPLSSSLDMFRLEVGHYPTTYEGLPALITKSSGLDESDAAKWAGPYIKDSSGLNDPWGHAYGYKCPGDVNQYGYDLWSNGPDGQSGTADDICNWMDMH